MTELWLLIHKYLETRFEIIEIDAQERLRMLLQGVIKLFMVLSLAFFILFFLLLGVGFSLSTVFGSYWVGFGVVALIFANMLAFILSPLSAGFWRNVDKNVEALFRKKQPNMQEKIEQVAKSTQEIDLEDKENKNDYE